MNNTKSVLQREPLRLAQEQSNFAFKYFALAEAIKPVS
jgi:hypothetical protein